MTILNIELDRAIDSQTFRQDFEGTTYQLKVIWVAREGIYQFEIYDLADALLASAPLVPGERIFSDYSARDNIPPGAFVINDTSGLGRAPTPDTLGVDVFLLYVESTDDSFV